MPQRTYIYKGWRIVHSYDGKRYWFKRWYMRVSVPSLRRVRAVMLRKDNTTYNKFMESHFPLVPETIALQDFADNPLDVNIKDKR